VRYKKEALCYPYLLINLCTTNESVTSQTGSLLLFAAAMHRGMYKYQTVNFMSTLEIDRFMHYSLVS